MKSINSKYPLLCTPMNQVSDINLAIAVSKAGAYPSLSIFNYEGDNEKIDLVELRKDLERFQNETGSVELLISMGALNLINNVDLLNLLIEKNMLTIELLDDVNDQTIPAIQGIRQDLKGQGFKLFFKEIAPRMIMEVDGLILKGPDGAGRSLRGSESLESLFLKMKRAFPSTLIIPSGGIGTKEKIKWYLDHGAEAVGIGTLFAASEESCLSQETKLKMVSASSRDIKKFENINQNALIFDRISDDDLNNTKSLKLGIKNPDAGGHVFAGKSIDHIDSIRPVSEIIKSLV